MKYEEASMEILRLSEEDIITSSGGGLFNNGTEDSSDYGEFGDWLTP